MTGIVQSGCFWSRELIAIVSESGIMVLLYFENVEYFWLCYCNWLSDDFYQKWYWELFNFVQVKYCYGALRAGLPCDTSFPPFVLTNNYLFWHGLVNIEIYYWRKGDLIQPEKELDMTILHIKNSNLNKQFL